MESLVASTSILFLFFIELINFFVLCNGWFGWVLFLILVIVEWGIFVVEWGIFVVEWGIFVVDILVVSLLVVG